MLFRSLPMKSRESWLAKNADTFATQDGYVHDVTDTDCSAPNGHVFSCRQFEKPIFNKQDEKLRGKTAVFIHFIPVLSIVWFFFGSVPI